MTIFWKESGQIVVLLDIYGLEYKLPFLLSLYLNFIGIRFEEVYVGAFKFNLSERNSLVKPSGQGMSHWTEAQIVYSTIIVIKALFQFIRYITLLQRESYH